MHGCTVGRPPGSGRMTRGPWGIRQICRSAGRVIMKRSVGTYGLVWAISVGRREALRVWEECLVQAEQSGFKGTEFI